MARSIIRCVKCGNISVVDTKNLWKFENCPNCGSSDLINMDDEFDLDGILEEKKENKNGK